VSRICAFFGNKDAGDRDQSGKLYHVRVPAPYPAAWHLIPGSSLLCRGLPAAAKIFWLFCALLWGELPGTGAFSAIPADHQSSGQSYLACLVGTGWIFYPQRPGSTNSHRSTSADGLCLSPFCLKKQKKMIWGKKPAVYAGGAVR